MTNFRHHGRYFILSPVTVTVVGTTSLRWKVKPSNFMQPHETKVLVFNFVTPSNHIRGMMTNFRHHWRHWHWLNQPVEWCRQQSYWYLILWHHLYNIRVMMTNFRAANATTPFTTATKLPQYPWALFHFISCHCHCRVLNQLQVKGEWWCRLTYGT